MTIQVAVNNVLFDSSDPLCQFILCTEKYAFIQAIEFTLIGEKKIKRCWGKWNASKPIKSIEKILRKGRAWPNLPPLPEQNHTIHFNSTPISQEPTLIDAYEALDRALYQAEKTLEPHKKRQAAESLLLAYQAGEIASLDFYFEKNR